MSDEPLAFGPDGVLIEKPPRDRRAPVPTMPAEHLDHARARLGRLTREELVDRYYALPGRNRIGAGTLLVDTALIDVLAFAGDVSHTTQEGSA